MSDSEKTTAAPPPPPMPSSALPLTNDEAMRRALDKQVQDAQDNLRTAQLAQQAALKPKIVDFSGFINIAGGQSVGPFTIYGENLNRVPREQIKINGLLPSLTGVRSHSIKGRLPIDLQPGPVTITVGDATFESTVGK